MRRALFCFVILSIALLAAAGQAAAQTPAPLPTCTAADQLVYLADPDAFQPVALAGSLYTMDLAVDHPEQVTNVALTYRGAATGDQAVSTPMPTAPKMRLGLGVPAKAPQLGTFELAWDQNVGQPLACHASVKGPFWIEPADADIGDWAAPSLKGTYKLATRPRNHRGRADSWKVTFRPSCDVFACDISGRYPGGRSWGNARYTLGSDDSTGRWEAFTDWQQVRGTYCGRFKNIASERIHFILTSDRYKVVPDGAYSQVPIVTTFGGSVRYEYRLNARGRAHCTSPPSTEIDSLRGTLLK